MPPTFVPAPFVPAPVVVPAVVAPAVVVPAVVAPAVKQDVTEEPDIVPLAVMERRLILAALRRTNSDVPRAAALLEINPSTVYRKLQTWRAEGLRDTD
jgi:two-component system repressor protein LuxO